MRRYDGILCMDFRRSRIEESVQLGRVAWKTGGPRGGGADKIRDKAFQDRASVSEPPRSNNFRLNFQKKIQKKHLALFVAPVIYYKSRRRKGDCRDGAWPQGRPNAEASRIPAFASA